MLVADFVCNVLDELTLNKVIISSFTQLTSVKHHCKGCQKKKNTNVSEKYHMYLTSN